MASYMPVDTWTGGEVLTPQAASSIATHADQFYRGKTAITRKDYGRGSVTYIGIKSDDKSLERSVLQDVFKKAGIATENYSPGVIVDWVNGIWVGVNYSDQPYDLAGGRKKEFIFGNSKLPVAGRAVWIER